MPKFENKYIHCVWEDWLKGKKVFFGDYIGELKRRVEENDERYVDTVNSMYSENYPFQMEDSGYFRFCYYDPHYGLKVAREQGKVIQRYWKSEQEWEEYIGDDFPDDISFYRIKPEGTKLVTNRELARWLAEGNGEYQMRKGDQFSCFNEYSYDAQDANEPTEIPCVRKWEDSEWHEPTREYMGLEK